MANTRPDTTRSADRQAAFLAVLAEEGQILASCKRAGVDRSTVWVWRKDPAFEERVQEALATWGETLVREAVRRGRDGYEEPTIFQGQYQYEMEEVRDAEGNVVLDEHGDTKWQRKRDAEGNLIRVSVRKYSDHLLGRTLEARVPGFARKTEISGPDGKPIETVDKTTAARKIAMALALGLQAAAQSAEEGDDLC